MRDGWSDPIPLPGEPLRNGAERGRYPAYLEHYLWPRTRRRIAPRPGKGDIRDALAALTEALREEE